MVFSSLQTTGRCVFNANKKAPKTWQEPWEGTESWKPATSFLCISRVETASLQVHQHCQAVWRQQSMERFWLMQEKSKHLKSLFPQAGTIYPPLLYEMHKRPEYPTAKLLISNNRRKNAECILVIPPTPKKQLSDFALVKSLPVYFFFWHDEWNSFPRSTRQRQSNFKGVAGTEPKK